MKEDALKKAGDDDEKKNKIDSRRDLRIGALGSGSDYTVFLDHLAISSVNTAFRAPVFGVYHSIYDSFDWYRRFGDPEFMYGRTLAQFHALAMARMADADVLPFEFTNFADTLSVYLDELDKLLKNKRRKHPAVSLDLVPLRDGQEQIAEAAAAYEKAFEEVFSNGGPNGDVAKVNAELRKFEQRMRLEGGLPGEREWYKHALYAPGFYTGYGVKTIPGVRESIEQNEWATAGEQVKVVRGIFDGLANQIRSAERELIELIP